MKNLFQFLTEVSLTPQAKDQARKMNLKSDGHGGWINSRGEFVAKTEGKRLKFFNQRQKEGEQDPPQKRKASGEDPTARKKAVGPVQQMAKRRADDDLAGAPLEKKPEEEGSDKEGKTLTTAFGRFNPPTTGHEKLFKFAKDQAKGGDLKIYPSRSQDNKKNPLDVDMKVSYMRKMFPDFEENIVNEKDMRTVFDVLTTAHEEGYSNVKIIVGADRLSEFKNLAQKYNGDLYDFEEIEVLSAGERTDAEDDSDDAPGDVSGMKSSKLRKYVMDDDFEKFKSGMPEKFEEADAQALFDAVRTGMKKKKDVKEDYDLWEIAPKQDPRGLRENYLLGKIFNLGQLVESLNTGLIGKVIRRGTNYLICVTEQDNMFKSWIHDVMETTKPKEKKPDTRVGTNAYYKYAVKMAPGSQEGAQNLLPGQKPYTIREFINKYRKK